MSFKNLDYQYFGIVKQYKHFQYFYNTLTLPMLLSYFCPLKHTDAKIFENQPNPVMFVINSMYKASLIVEKDFCVLLLSCLFLFQDAPFKRYEHIKYLEIIS